MSDQPQGEGWWLASDGKYYPPQPEQQAPQTPPSWGPGGPQQFGTPQPFPQQQPPQQQIVVKQGAGCLKIGLIVLAVLFVLGLIGFGCLAMATNEAVKQIDSSIGVADEADYELTGPECSIDEFSGPKATGTITNTSDKKQAFQVKVRFTAPDGSLVSSDSTFTNGIEPGQSQDWKISTFKSDAPEGTACAIEEISYSIFD